jgi:hypothetical protein
VSLEQVYCDHCGEVVDKSWYFLEFRLCTGCKDTCVQILKKWIRDEYGNDGP